MYNLIFNPNPDQVLDDHNNRLKAAEQERLACQAARLHSGLHERAAVALGRMLVNLGQRLQDRYGLFQSPYLTTVEKEM
jgi:hypothetical protein